MKFAFTSALCSTLLVLAGCSKPADAPPPPQPPPEPAAAIPPAAPPKPALDESKPVLLRQHWEAGRRYNHRVRMEQLSYTTTVSTPHALEQRVNTRQDYHIDVVQPSPLAELEATFEVFAISMSQSGIDLLTFDSTEPADPTNPAHSIRQGLGRLVGQKLTFFTTPSNTVDRVAGIDEVRARLLTNAAPHAHVILAGMLTTDSLKNMVELARGFPSTPASVGDHWALETAFSLGPQGTALVSGTNTFTGWDDKAGKRCALIQYSARITRKPDDNPPANPNEPIRNLHNGILSGKGWFDPVEGTLVESVTEQSMTLIFNFPTHPEAAVDRNATNVVATTITLQLLGITAIPPSAPQP